MQWSWVVQVVVDLVADSSRWLCSFLPVVFCFVGCCLFVVDGLLFVGLQWVFLLFCLSRDWVDLDCWPFCGEMI